MLAWIGAIAIVALFGLIITKRLSPLVALIVVPVAASLAAGFGLATGKFIVHGVQNIGPIAGMFVFAILFSESSPMPECSIRSSRACCA